MNIEFKKKDWPEGWFLLDADDYSGPHIEGTKEHWNGIVDYLLDSGEISDYPRVTVHYNVYTDVWTFFNPREAYYTADYLRINDSARVFLAHHIRATLEKDSNG
jgi:hypothetical protein